MTINLKAPELRELKPRIMVCGVGGAGGNAVNNMITSGLAGVDFIVANTDAQALMSAKSERIIQMGLQVTEGLGAGSQPEVGRASAEEAIEEIRDHLAGAHMVFVTAGMGGGTGTGAAPVIARTARDMGILTVGVVTKPFQFEGMRRMRIADLGIEELHKSVDTLIVIPNQNLFRVANEKTTFADAFSMADQVLYSGVACITDLMVREGLINLDFADVRAIMRDMGKAMMGTGEASGERRAILAAEAAIANPLLDEVSMKGAARPADLDHRRQRPHPLRSGRGRQPHPPGSRRGSQHHPRRHLRLQPRRHRSASPSSPPASTSRPASLDMNDQRFAEAAERMRAQAAAARQAGNPRRRRTRRPLRLRRRKPITPRPPRRRPPLRRRPTPRSPLRPMRRRRLRPRLRPRRAAQVSAYAPQPRQPEQSYAPHHGDVQLKAVSRPRRLSGAGPGPGPAAPHRSSPRSRRLSFRRRPNCRSARRKCRRSTISRSPARLDPPCPWRIFRRPGAGNPSPHPAGASRHFRHEPRRGACGRRSAPFRAADRAANGPADRASRSPGAAPSSRPMLRVRRSLRRPAFAGPCGIRQAPAGAASRGVHRRPRPRLFAPRGRPAGDSRLPASSVELTP